MPISLALLAACTSGSPAHPEASKADTASGEAPRRARPAEPPEAPLVWPTEPAPDLAPCRSLTPWIPEVAEADSYLLPEGWGEAEDTWLQLSRLHTHGEQVLPDWRAGLHDLLKRRLAAVSNVTVGPGTLQTVYVVMASPRCEVLGMSWVPHDPTIMGSLPVARLWWALPDACSGPVVHADAFPSEDDPGDRPTYRALSDGVACVQRDGKPIPALGMLTAHPDDVDGTRVDVVDPLTGQSLRERPPGETIVKSRRERTAPTKPLPTVRHNQPGESVP